MAVDPSADGSQRLNERLSRAFEASKTATGMRTVRHWTQHSLFFAAVVRLIRAVGGALRRWLDGSALYTTATRLLNWLEMTLGRWVTNAWGYRWLTAEPDPDVIVIDLRDAKTVAPLLRLLDRAVPAAVSICAHSRCLRLGGATLERLRAEPLRIAGGALLVAVVAGAIGAVLTGNIGAVRLTVLSVLSIAGGIAFRDRRSWAELREGRLIGLLAGVFVPPDPPRRDDRSDRNEEPSASEDHRSGASDSDQSPDCCTDPDSP